MKSTICAAALAAVALLSLAACTTSNTIDGHQVRGTVEPANVQMTDAHGLHANAPQWFKDYWAKYLRQAQGYGVLAVDRNGRGASYYYCLPGSGCHNLAGNQHKSAKDVRYTHAALQRCNKFVRENYPAAKPDCAVYAIRDKIVWKGPFPWHVASGDPAQRYAPSASAGEMSTRSVSTTWQGYEDILNGSVSFETGGPADAPKRMVMVLDDGKLTCDGTYIPARSQWEIACSNGREAGGHFVGLGQGKGAHGQGTDNLGNTVQFIMSAK